MKTKYLNILALIIIALIFQNSFSQGPLTAVQKSDPIIDKTGHLNLKIIEGKRISNAEESCINLQNQENVIIRNCIFESSAAYGIYLLNCKNILIENCSFESNSAGINAVHCQQIQVINNKFSNPQGPSNPRGQFVQFNNVTGPRNRINNNIGESIIGISDPEDMISLFESYGTIDDPIQVIGNIFKGGGPSTTGGGIMTGDKGGSNIIVKDNILVNPGQYGIAIASGTNIEITNNTVFSNPFWFNNVGIYAWNQDNSRINGSGILEEADDCANNLIRDNIVKYHNPSRINNGWISENCDFIDGNSFYTQNEFNEDLNENIIGKYFFAPDLMFHYSFNNNATDSSGNNLKINNKGSVDYSNDNVFLNGNDAYIYVENDSALRPVNEKLSFSTWINPSSTTNSETRGIAMSSKSNGWEEGWRITQSGKTITVTINIIDEVYEESGNLINTEINRYSITSEDALNELQWNNIIFNYDQNEMQLYINGTLKASKDLQANSKVDYTDSVSRRYYARKIKYDNNKTNGLKIGYSDGLEFFNGYISDFKIFRGVLSPDQITEEQEYKPESTTNPIVKTPNESNNNDLMVSYEFDGNYLDDSLNALHANNNGIDYEFKNEGKNQSLSFNGDSNYVGVASAYPILIENQLTISTWIKPDLIDGALGVLQSANSDGYNSGWRIIVDRSLHKYNLIIARITTTEGSFRIVTDGITFNEWQHIALTYDNKEVKLYINGQLKKSEEAFGNILYNGSNSDLRIGHTNGTQYYSGLIDELEIYNTALSDLGISEIYTDNIPYYNGSTPILTPPNQEPTTELTVNYKFDGNYLDDSVNNLHGLNSNPNQTFIVDGKNESLKLNGDSFVSIASSNVITLENKVSISAWIKPNSIIGNVGLLKSANSNGYTNGWRVTLYTSNNENYLIARVSTTEGSKSAITKGIKINQWQHITFTYDGKQIQIFIDGLLLQSSTLSGNIIYENENEMKIGHSNGTQYYDGQIDELEIYNSSLTDSEINDIYTNNLIHFQNNDNVPVTYKLIANYKFNNNYLDNSENNLHGINSNTNQSFLTDGNNESLSLNGDSFVGINSNELLNLKNEFTISTWIKPYSIDGTVGIVKSANSNGYTSGWRLITFSSGSENYLMARVSTSNGGKSIITKGIKINEWQHVALTYNDEQIQIFINGELLSSANHSGTIIYENENEMKIGHSNGTKYYDGQIDELQLYSNALTEDGIKEIFESNSEYFNIPSSKITNTSNEINSVNVYPNPSTDVINIVSSNFEEGDQFKIMGIIGQHILTKKITSFKSTVDISNLSNGVYFLEIISKNNRTKQIIKILKI